MTTLILGASDKKERYSHKALRMLLEHGHQVALVHPSLNSVDGIPVSHAMTDIKPPIDTVTIYVSASISDGLAEEFLKIKPRRVIFNPGAENPRLSRVLRANSISTIDACTLVLLQTNQY
jgi:predicted CoA-binding protein